MSECLCVCYACTLFSSHQHVLYFIVFCCRNLYIILYIEDFICPVMYCTFLDFIAYTACSNIGDVI